MKKILLITIITLSTLLNADPWGIDSEIANPSFPAPRETAMSHLGQKMVQFHRDVLSKADGARSHYIPSSSHYTQLAMKKHGFFKGFTMGCDRLMRENSDPWLYKVSQHGSYTLKYDYPK